MHGFIILNRSIFEHPLFGRRPDWQRPFEWLIAMAAWQDVEFRTPRGSSIDLKRGQLAVTVRDLADAWGWPKSNVETCLRAFEDEAMILCARTRTKTRTRFGTRSSHPITLITVCNYDKFQNSPQQRTAEVGQKLGQKLGQDLQQQLDLPAEKVAEPLNHSNQEQQKIEANGGFGGRRSASRRAHCPADGAQSEKMYFSRVGGEFWDAFVADFRTVRGAEPFPLRYDDGFSGCWFMKLGEATRPVKRQRRAA